MPSSSYRWDFPLTVLLLGYPHWWTPFAKLEYPRFFWEDHVGSECVRNSWMWLFRERNRYSFQTINFTKTEPFWRPFRCAEKYCWPQGGSDNASKWLPKKSNAFGQPNDQMPFEGVWFELVSGPGGFLMAEASPIAGWFIVCIMDPIHGWWLGYHDFLTLLGCDDASPRLYLEQLFSLCHRRQKVGESELGVETIYGNRIWMAFDSPSYFTNLG